MGCQSEEAVEVDDVVVPEQSEGFFWETEHDGNQIYFLGTAHIGVEDMYPLSDEIESAMDHTDLLLTEIDNSSEENTQALMAAQRPHMRLPPGHKLDEHIDAEYHDELEDVAEYRGIDYGMLNQFQPWVVEDLYNELMIMESDYDYNLGVENYLYDNVLDDQTESMALENYGERLTSVRARDLDYQTYVLEQVFKQNEEMDSEEMLERSVTAFRAGEEELLDYERVVPEDVDNPEHEETYLNELLFKRDEKMADRIDEIVTERDGETIMVAVGLMHFFGEDNIRSLLEDKGYEIERR
nr:TraB/GumN family protein [Alkalibacillus almallahensis]